MSSAWIRPARNEDLPRLTEIYNHYVVHSPATFDLEPKTIEQRYEWFAQFKETGRHRLLVAEEGGVVMGYAGDNALACEARVRHDGGDDGLLCFRGGGAGDRGTIVCGAFRGNRD